MYIPQTKFDWFVFLGGVIDGDGEVLNLLFREEVDKNDDIWFSSIIDDNIDIWVKCSFISNNAGVLEETFLWVLLEKGKNMSVVHVSDGDSPDYIQIQLPYNELLLKFFNATIAKSERNFDFKKKVWFVKKQTAEIFLKGLQSLIDKRTFLLTISDSRTPTPESFEDFFNEAPPQVLSPKQSKDTLIEFFQDICNSIHLLDDGITFGSTDTLGDLKPYYRKAAMILHPDKNNGDGSRMSELNMVWAKLQEYL